MMTDAPDTTGRVLVVDDDERNRKLLSRFLAAKGFAVREANDGIEALEAVSSEHPDAILLDVMMPRLDGFEVCRRLKSNPETAHIPVLLVTMLSDRSDRLTGIEAGANDFLSKPVDLDETLLRVRNAVMHKQLFDENIYYQQELENLVEERTRALKQAFEELKESQEQIIQQEKLATIGQLSAGVAHEINTPISYISLNISSLSEYIDQFREYQQTLRDALSSATGEEADKLRDLFNAMNFDLLLESMAELVTDSLEGTHRIVQIVKSLKNFSRRDENEVSPTDINECIENTLKFVWNELKYKATVVKEYGQLPKINCYPQQLSQVFMNLLVNAAHAIESRGTITIRTYTDEGDIVAEIEDDGAGISAENMKRIFEAFFTTKPLDKGTGLGLSIAAKIIEKHNGTIQVASTPGKGTIFTLRLPVIEGQALPAKSNRHAEAGQPARKTS